MIQKKIISIQDLGDVVFTRNSRASRITIRIGADGTVKTTLPWLCSFRAGAAFVRVNARRIAARREKMLGNAPVTPAASEELIEELRAQAKSYLPVRTLELAERYHFTVNKIFIKHNSSNWGSCSQKGNINLNLNLMRVPRELQDYVILHELCHLREMNHGQAFHELLESLSTDLYGSTFPQRPLHKYFAKQLRSYRLI